MYSASPSEISLCRSAPTFMETNIPPWMPDGTFSVLPKGCFDERCQEHNIPCPVDML